MISLSAHTDNGTPQTKEPSKDPAAFSKKKEFLILNLGTLIVAIGVYFFKYPNHFAMGGVSGLSVVLAALIPGATPAVTSMVINVILLIAAFIIFGRSFAFKTVYATLLMSFLLVGFEELVPMKAPLTDETMLEMFFAIGFSALGSAMLFNLRASTGGTDIIAMIIQKFVHIDIGMALLASDILIAGATFFIFDVKTGLFSVTGLLLKGVIVDNLIESFNRVKYFTIITTHPDEIGGFITKTLKRGTTRIDGRGEFTGENKTVFLCVVRRYQAVILRDFVKKTDPKAFLMITSTSEIVGRGFRSPF